MMTTSQLLQPLVVVACLLVQLSSSSTASFVPRFAFAFSTSTTTTTKQKMQPRQKSSTSQKQQSIHHLSIPRPLRATPRPWPSNPITSTTGDSTSTIATTTPIAKPRTGFAQTLLDMALASPIWTYILVPQARATIVATAEKNGIPWFLAKQWLARQMEVQWNTNNENQCRKKDQCHVDNNDNGGGILFPEYYLKSFHAYPEGNLCYDAALEQELASRAVGARNFPKFSSRGEDVFRDAFDVALYKLGAGIVQHSSPSDNQKQSQENEVVIVDFGCGTGTSTRRLAKQYRQATQLIGIDLSPYFIEVGQTLLKLSPSAIVLDHDNETFAKAEVNGWITDINSDDRILLRQGDMANTQLPSNFVAVVNLSLVVHELPIEVSKQVIQEAHRILRPGGQLWISEMDFESPAYKAQRENALLFSLLRATEPYLDEYADGTPELRHFIAELFDVVKITAATGRHFALLAEKGNSTESGGHATLEDYRFREDGSYAIEDTHLKPWESKEMSLVESST